MKLPSYLAIIYIMNSTNAEQYSQNLGYWIKRYSLLANQAMEAALRPYGLGRTQWYVLFHIHAQQPMPQRSLQALLQVESATLTAIIRPLTQKELITQVADKNDKRSKNLVLTRKGQRLWGSLPDPIYAVRVKALKGIDQDDIEKARLVIEAAVNNLGKGA